MMMMVKLMNNDIESVILDLMILYLYVIFRFFLFKLNSRFNIRALCKNKLCGIIMVLMRDMVIYSVLFFGN